MTFIIQDPIISHRKILYGGGTFDKEFEIYFKDTHLQELLNTDLSQAPLEIRTLTIAESLEMTDQDSELIAYESNNCKENQVVITQVGTKGVLCAGTILFTRSESFHKLILVIT